MYPIRLLIPDLPQYSKEDGEFFKRELGLIPEWIPTDTTDPLSPGSLLFCYQIEDWEARLMATPSKSVVVIMAANEYYDVHRWGKLNLFPAVRAALIEYYPVRLRIQPALYPFRWILGNPGDLFNRVFWGESKRAFLSWLEIRSLKFHIPIFSLPAGYTNVFVKELKLLDLLESEVDSLFRSLKLIGDLPKDGISFFGQKGSFARRRMISYFSESSEIEISQYDTYGGFSNNSHSTAYVESILNNRFVLCPPGNKTNCTHRYLETIILGAIPIITENTVQDWTGHDFYPLEIQHLNRDYKKLWKFFSQQSESELITLRNKLKSHARESISSARKFIENWCEESLSSS